MRRTTLVPFALAFLLVFPAQAAFFVRDGSSAAHPRLILVERSPVVIEGTGFGPNEQVVVTVRAPKLVVKRTLRANGAGRFRATLPALRLVGSLRCANGVTIVARPERGSLLLWRPPRLPNCAAPLPIAPA